MQNVSKFLGWISIAAAICLFILLGYAIMFQINMPHPSFIAGMSYHELLLMSLIVFMVSFMGSVFLSKGV